jgi:iron complex outermembrane receptor protein
MPLHKGMAFSAWLLVVFTTVFAPLSYAQTCQSRLEGIVTASDAEQPLAYADITIHKYGLSTRTDEKGQYQFKNLCPNVSYTLEINYLNRKYSAQSIVGEMYFDIQFPADPTLSEVVVSARSAPLVHTESVAVVDRLEMESKQAVSLAEVVRQIPGVSVLQTGSNIGKPVIQGLHSNRIAIVNNDIVLESQQWGSEHAPEVDPFSASKISVIKGALGVKYGAGAMGGAIVLEPEPLRTQAGWGGWAALGGFSNGWSGVAASAVDYRSKNEQWAARVQTTAKRGGNMRTPDYWLYNSGHMAFNIAALGEWKQNAKIKHEFGFSRYEQKFAVLRASHLGNADQILQASQLDTPMNNIDRFSWAIGRPFQSVKHYTAQYKVNFRSSDFWRFKSIFSHQFNHRREYDVVRKTGAAADKAQVAFRLWTNTLDLQAAYLGQKYWHSEGGIQLSQSTNYVNRGAFIPNYYGYGISAWVHERWRKHNVPWEWEMGMRYDGRASRVFTEGNGARDINRTVRFGNISGTTGLHYNINQQTTITLHSGYAWRPPSVYELFAKGVHHGSGTYEEGDTALVSEKAWNTNLSLHYASNKANGWQIDISVYRNQIRDFIYLDPQNTVRITVRGPFPAYYYKQADAVLQGIDAQVVVPILKNWALETRASIIRADRQLRPGEITGETSDPLPLIPSDRYQYGLKWTQNTNTIRCMANTVQRQWRIPNAGLLKDAPKAFTTFSLDASHQIKRGDKPLEIGISIQNLTNTRYREYLNFFRFYADEPGVNIGIRIKKIF